MNLEQLIGLLSVGVKKGASDVHLQAGYPPAYRIRGELFAARHDKLTSEDIEVLAKQILGEDGTLNVRRLDLDRGFGIPGLSRFRASILRQRGALGLVLRIIPFEVPSIAQLNLPPVLESIARLRQGLVLVTGATGNGKSTTLAAMINHANQSARLHVICIEDPIEFILQPDKSLILQREVGSDTESFETALRAALRQDPDVLMVGELRDRATADTCLKAAETGHLVLSTIHTTDVARSIGRYVGLFSPEEQLNVRHRLAESLRALICLRLVPRRDGQALVPAAEILLSTRTVQDLVRDPSRTEELVGVMEKSHDVGMQTFDQHLVELVRKGMITQDTAKANATRRAEIDRALMMGGPS